MTPTDGEIVKKYIDCRDFLKARDDAFENGDPVLAELIAQCDRATSDSNMAAACLDLIKHIRWQVKGKKPFTGGMEVMEGTMALRFKERGDESIRTEFGTVYQSTTLTCRVADREVFIDFVRQADAFDLLSANIAKDALKVHMEEHQGSPPPGVDVTWITKTLFRRA